MGYNKDPLVFGELNKQRETGFSGFPLLAMLKIRLVSDMGIQNIGSRNRFAALGVLFGRLEVHGGFAMTSQFVQTNGFVEMSFTDGGIRLGRRLEMFQRDIVMSLAPVIYPFLIVFHRASVGTGWQRHGTFPSK